MIGLSGIRGKVNISLTDDEITKLRRSADTRTIIHIGHPAGIMDVESVSHMEAGTPVMDKLAFYRTARTIMDGLVYVPFCRLAD